MTISRRWFFKGIATVVALAAIPKVATAAFGGDPRIAAWRMLDESEAIFKKHGKSQAYFDKTVELFDFMVENFLYSEPPSFDVQVAECSDLLKRQGKYKDGITENHWRTCCDSTFAIMIVRDGLKYRQLPMIQASNWKKFARQYSRVFMAA